ncbi:MAG: signal peptidase II [Alteromonadaceae bacterium]|jgi:signal peptidase II
MPDQMAKMPIRQTGLWWLWLTAIIYVLDQFTKVWIINSVDLFEKIPLLPVFNITHVHNYGAAFSFLSDAGGWQRWFFTGITIVVSVVLLWFLYKTPRTNKLLGLAYSLVLGGAMGNLYDRMSYGYVEDFIHVYYQNWHFPAFNVADSAITIGAFLLIFDAFTNNPDSSSRKSSDNESENEVLSDRK